MLKNLKIFWKIMSVICIMALFMAAVGFTSKHFADKLSERLDDMYHNQLTAVKVVNAMRAQSRAVEALAMEIILTNMTPERMYHEQSVLADRVSEFDRLMDVYEKTKLDTYQKERLVLVKNDLAVYRQVRGQAIQMAIAGQRAEGYKHFEEYGMKQLDNVNVLLKELADYNAKISEQAMEEGQAEAIRSDIIVLIVTLSAVVLAIILGIILARAITNPVQTLQNLMAQAGNGDLTVKAKEDSQDELGQLSQSFNEMIKNQMTIVTMVRKSAVNIAAASEELAASSEEVTSTASEVARSIQTVANEMNEANQSVNNTSQVLLELSSLIQIAKNKASSATKNAGETFTAVNQGQATVAATVSRMNTIKEKTVETEQHIQTLSKYSEQIGLITDTITSIASQTNLLALNAAIEAARAGEAGRGFAVVAEEVRKLAGQSNAGAAEVANLVRKAADGTATAVQATQLSRTEVEMGVTAVNQAGQSLLHIVEAINKTVADTNEIATVTNDEVASSEKIVKLIHAVASSVENTAANAEEVSAATEQTTATMQTVAASSEEMSAMANDLRNAVLTFKVT